MMNKLFNAISMPRNEKRELVLVGMLAALLMMSLM